MGDGGGWSSLTGEFAVAVSIEEGELGGGRESARLLRVNGDFPLLPDFTEAASDFSCGSPFARMAELRGLSVLPEPGILDRSDRKDRDDSLVSDLLKEG